MSRTIRVPILNSYSNDIFDITSTTLDMVKSQLYVLIMTPIGSRVMIPGFGTMIYSLLFNQNHENVSTLIKNEIVEKSKIYVPRCNILDVVVDVVENSIDIAITFSLKEDSSQVGTLDIVLVTQ